MRTKPKIEGIHQTMLELIEIARSARKNDEYPIAAAIMARNGRVISMVPNAVKTKNDPSAHAEIEAIRTATKKLKSRYLTDLVLVTTHEPCPMCLTCAAYADLSSVVYGATQGDIKRYSDEWGTEDFKWRATIYDKQRIINQIKPEMQCEEYMRTECSRLLYL